LQYEIDESGIASIDLFIGADKMVNRGIGTQAIKLLLEYIRARHHSLTVTIDPSPANTRAIRCYEKVGFRHYETVQMASGEMAYMMKIEYQNSETLKTKEGSKWDS
jgi:RimJ/RimL family protein N-acetyltransferase